ncbi:DNA topoisomerase 3, partial [Desulfovibrio sp. OttesenSCG-928-G15]|nr:DNA topoisomerase 3 [Desulfovibrio sp. OttesenSCG-928-G15]
MRLFIAEKPNLGKAIAAGLGKGSSGGGFIKCGNDTVTWCFGHMLEPAYPEDYSPEFASWKREHLPIIPAAWKYKTKRSAAAQLKVIGKLLREAKSVVNAGDPDREGQLLIDEVLEHFGYKGPVERIWLASLDDCSVKKALDGMTDNAKYAPLRDSARARMQADWLIGMNATRAMTIMGRETGRGGEVLSLGRVQTPTLALVVARDREITSFVSSDYYVLRAYLTPLTGGEFSAMFVPAETQAGLDTSGRLTDGVVANALAEAAKGADGTVTHSVRENKSKAAPLPHCLSSLQKEASAKLNLTAKQVLDTAQALYDKKLTTYPRTDCRYLPEEQFDAAKTILANLSGIPNLDTLALKADAKLKSSAWNTKKVTAHHAIIPTGEMPGNLTNAERSLFSLIASAYCLQFYPPMRYEAQKITLTIPNAQGGNTLWEAKGRQILEAGWTAVSGNSDDSDAQDGEQEQALPLVKQGEKVHCRDVRTLKKKTSPPSRFTEGTLIEAMANVHRFVADAAAKSVLKENEGIGTEATRAGILETLKQRQFLIADKKAIVSTKLGQDIIDMTPTSLKDPITTASWESRLEAIAQSKETLANFMTEQIRILPELLAPILGSGNGSTQTPAHSCPD